MLNINLYILYFRKQKLILFRLKNLVQNKQTLHQIAVKLHQNNKDLSSIVKNLFVVETTIKILHTNEMEALVVFHPIDQEVITVPVPSRVVLAMTIMDQANLAAIQMSMLDTVITRTTEDMGIKMAIHRVVKSLKDGKTVPLLTHKLTIILGETMFKRMQLVLDSRSC